MHALQRRISVFHVLLQKIVWWLFRLDSSAVWFWDRGCVQARGVEKRKGPKEKGLSQKLNAATRKLQMANKVGASASTKLQKATKNVGNDIL